KKMPLRREDKGKTPVDKSRRSRSRYIIEEAGPSTSIPTIDPVFTQYRDPGGGSSTSHSSPMHSLHEEQGDDDDHAEQVVHDETDQEHRNARILRNVPQVIRKRNGRFVIQPKGSS
ncbi:hypothetical protein RYX36_012458, partial [Vicia faba]